MDFLHPWLTQDDHPAYVKLDDIRLQCIIVRVHLGRSHYRLRSAPFSGSIANILHWTL